MWVLPTGVSILLLSVMPIIDHQIFGYLHHVHDFSKKLFDFKTTWEQQVWLPLLKTKFSVISPFIVHTKLGCQIFVQIWNQIALVAKYLVARYLITRYLNSNQIYLVSSQICLVAKYLVVRYLILRYLNSNQINLVSSQIFLGGQIFGRPIFDFKPDLFGFKSVLFGCWIFNFKSDLFLQTAAQGLVSHGWSLILTAHSMMKIMMTMVI